MRHNTISVIGAGNVGATCAYALVLKNVCGEILLADADLDRCAGQVSDLSDALPFSETSRVLAADLKEAGGADVIIITAGAAQKPGQTRLELVDKNKQILESILEKLEPAPESVILVISNPVDVLTYHAQRLLPDRPAGRVFGSGTYLDTQRLRGNLSELLNIAEQSIHAYVLGEHGNSQFVAWSESTAGGKPLREFLRESENMEERLADKTMREAYDIIQKKGATYYGIGACAAKICESVLYDQKKILPVSCFLEEYDVALSMPAVIGENGVERVIQLRLNEDEARKMKRSVEEIRRYL